MRCINKRLSLCVHNATIMSASGKHTHAGGSAGGPGEHIPEGTHLDVIDRMLALVSKDGGGYSEGFAAQVINQLAHGSTRTASVLNEVCARQAAAPAAKGGKPSPGSSHQP